MKPPAPVLFQFRPAAHYATARPMRLPPAPSRWSTALGAFLVALAAPLLGWAVWEWRA
jgi:hypothetical protein